MLNIGIITENNYCIMVGKSLQSDSIKRNELYPNRKYFKLMSAMDDIEDIPGDKCLIVGKEYIINNRRYDLQSGYAIVAKVTPDFKIYPELRRAKGKETGVIKNKNGFGILDRWPVLENIFMEKENTNSIIKESEDNPFISKITHLNISDENFSEYDNE